jgi:hypothetical protein
VRFVPNKAQTDLLSNLWYRNIILKARQLGFSTLVQLMELDQCIFNPDIRAGVIAQDKDSATVIFRDKIKFAWNRMPPLVHEQRQIVTNSASELVFDNNSGIRVATSLRSGTLQYLHVSEFGKICARTPDKAREVLTGSLPAVAPDGFTFIESTAEGRSGAFFDMSTTAQRNQAEGKPESKLDFRFHFFAWFDAPEYRIETGEFLSDEDNRYFDSLEVATGATIDNAQRAWYVAKRRTDYSGDAQMMKQEYPSLPSEAFEQSVEGCYYVQQMLAARKEGRIGHVPYMPGHLVNTFWDIGHGDGTAIWFHQRIAGQDRFIRFYEAWGEPYSHFVSEMNKYGYVFGKHYLPHDANHRRQGMVDNSTPEEMLQALGLQNTEIVPVIDRKINGIQMTRNVFPAFWFDATNCAKGIDHLDGYHKEWDARNACWRQEPQHDIHSEAADAIRQCGQVYESLGQTQAKFTFAPTRAVSPWGPR